MNKYCVSLKTAKALKQAGFPQENSSRYYCGGHTMYFEDQENGKFEDCENTDLLQEDEYCHTAGLVCDFFLAAPIAEEILKELPAQYEEGATKPWLTCAKNRANEFEVGYMTTKAGFIDGHITNKSLAEAAAICWIYLKKNNLIGKK